MKIAFLLGSIHGTGGIARATSIIAQCLSCDDKNEVFVINYWGLRAEKEDVECEKIHYTSILDNAIPMRKGLFKAMKRLRRFLLANKIDVLISCGALYFTLGALSTKRTHTKAIAWEHSNYTSNFGHIGKKYNRLIGGKLSDFVVTLTYMDQENYLNHVRKEGVEFIYNPMDPRLLREKVVYNAESTKIVTVGNLNAFKNYNDLLLVARELFQNPKFSNWSWDIYGEGPDREEIETRIGEYGLQGRVVLKGRSERIYELLNEYSIYVCTSKSEGLPMALIEAKAKMLPIVSFDIMTGPREIIDDGKNGYLVKLHDIKGMVEKVSLLMESADKRKQFSVKSYEGIQKFSLEVCANKWNMVLKKVMELGV